MSENNSIDLDNDGEPDESDYEKYLTPRPANPVEGDPYGTELEPSSDDLTDEEAVADRDDFDDDEDDDPQVTEALAEPDEEDDLPVDADHPA